MSILERIKQIQGMTFGREHRYRCPECQDTGWVSIWSPATVKRAVAGHDGPWKTCVLACSCESSDFVANKFRAGKRSGKTIPVFGDEPWHVNAKRTDAKAKAALYEHRPENFNEAFAGMDTTERMEVSQ